MTEEETEKLWGDAFWRAQTDEDGLWNDGTWDDYVPSPAWMDCGEEPAQTLVLPAEEQLVLSFERDDMEGLRRKAEAQGLSCQVLICSILHRYLNGSLVDIDEARKLFPSGNAALAG